MVDPLKSCPYQPDQLLLDPIKATYRLQYPLKLVLPTLVESKDPDKKVRTSTDLVNWRLIENGIRFNAFQDVNQSQYFLHHFRADLLQSGCFHDVQVGIVKAPSSTAEENRLLVSLEEKNWYRIYIGGGIKQQGLGDNSAVPLSFDNAPAAQMETSIGLLNLTGCLDNTTFQYTVDQHAASTWNLVHERPLYAAIPNWAGALGSIFKQQIISQPRGTQYSISMRAALETMDYEYTRSYKEFQRLVSFRLANQTAGRRPELAPFPIYMGWEWNLLFRDLIPKRHAQIPYALDASPEIVEQAGPSLKHSLQWEYRNNQTNSRFNPTLGSNLHWKAELAMPPGDVGFWKVQGGWAVHHPVAAMGSDRLCWHASFSTGLLRPLLFGGICNPPTVSDRFFCGGPLQLRGFLPSGIGPRSNHFQDVDTAASSNNNKSRRISSLTPNGDALGGDFFYVATLATSVGLGGLQQPSFLSEYVRCFAFVNVGTLTGLQSSVSWTTLLQSSRVAVGAGCSVATPAGRLELTYSIPMQFSPRDARRSVQFGLGFSFE